MTGSTLRWATEADARSVAVAHLDSWRAACVGLIPRTCWLWSERRSTQTGAVAGGTRAG
ncbi:hypothetical protein [Pseudoclavibacter sp. AY1F1]|uniref:hypothetical protein n=1 Tax=Pseudoclavibacter sp. AY1F1 TaxID=2080583 RepID=UPI0015E283D1|nr:hypothetical protein [Pseudoclavibacter sp. AY1F1]